MFTGMMLVQLFYWGTNQAIIQRAFAAKNLAEGQKGLLLAAVIKILGPLIVVLPGSIAYHVFEGGLDVADKAYPELVARVLPPYLLGFFAAVLFGAILSSFNSALNSSVTLFGIDIYRRYYRPEATDREVVAAGKKFGVVLALLAMCVAPFIANAPSGLFGYLQEVNGCYSIPILTIVVGGYATKRVPALAAKVALASGVVLYILSQFVLKNIVGADSYPHFLHVMAILFVANVIIMLVIGKLRPREVDYVQSDVGAVDIHVWPWAKYAGAAVVLVVVSIYYVFA